MARVFALGGSILSPDRPDAEYAQRFSDLVAERLAVGERALIVTGGGGPARHYIRAARALGITEDALDEMGIAATRLNARFLREVLAARFGALVAPGIQTTTAASAAAGAKHPIVVMGGTVPGHSTDYVGAELAVAAGAGELVVLTNIDGVYTADPKLDPKATRLPELTTARLVDIAGRDGWTAGKIGVVDPPCARYVHEHGLRVRVLDGRDLRAVRSAFAGAPAGSLVTPGG